MREAILYVLIAWLLLICMALGLIAHGRDHYERRGRR